MKKITAIFFILSVSVFVLFKITGRKDFKVFNDESEEDDDKNYDYVPGMTGPSGERVFIGAGGGRYYSKQSLGMYANFSK